MVNAVWNFGYDVAPSETGRLPRLNVSGWSPTGSQSVYYRTAHDSGNRPAGQL